MPKSKISQASQASRVTDFNMHECNVSDAEFIISSRFKVDSRFKNIFFYFLQGFCCCSFSPLQNPLFRKQTNAFHIG